MGLKDYTEKGKNDGYAKGKIREIIPSVRIRGSDKLRHVEGSEFIIQLPIVWITPVCRTGRDLMDYKITGIVIMTVELKGLGAMIKINLIETI